MNILPSQKKAAPKSVVPIVSQWRVPGVRRMRGLRYNTRGECIGVCGPRKPVPDKHTQQIIERAYAEAAKKPMPQEGGAFDLAKFKPLLGNLLIVRGPEIKEINGVAVPESTTRHEFWWVVVRVGDGVDGCGVGDRVILHKKTKPKQVRLGEGKFYLTRETVVVAVLESV